MNLDIKNKHIVYPSTRDCNALCNCLEQYSVLKLASNNHELPSGNLAINSLLWKPRPFIDLAYIDLPIQHGD